MQTRANNVYRNSLPSSFLRVRSTHICHSNSHQEEEEAKHNIPERMSHKASAGGSAAAAKKAKLQVEAVDPVVTKVQETLEENLTYFIDNIAGLVKRYDVLLGRALQQNRGTAAEIAQIQAAAEKAEAEEGAAAAAAADDGKKKAEPDAAKPVAADGSDVKAEGHSAVAPIVRQASMSRMPSSPLLKRAASDAQVFPHAASTDALPAAATGTASSGADAGAATSKTVNNKKKGAKKQQKIRIVEVKFPDNTNIVTQLRLLKREAYELGATMDGIHDWIALNVPDIKEDENEGVEVMGAVIEQVSSLTETVRAVYSVESGYLEGRADLEKAMLKNPESKTMMLALEAHDCDTWDEIDRGFRTMIRVSLLLYTVLSRNMKVLSMPRQQNHASAMFM